MTKMTIIPENYNNIRAGIVELLKAARSAAARNLTSSFLWGEPGNGPGQSSGTAPAPYLTTHLRLAQLVANSPRTAIYDTPQPKP
jgi:hypothetical protein